MSGDPYPMPNKVYERHIKDALQGAWKGLAEEAGVVMPSVIGAVVISVHQSEPDEPPRLHIATNLMRSGYLEVMEHLTNNSAVEPDATGYLKL